MTHKSLCKSLKLYEIYAFIFSTFLLPEEMHYEPYSSGTHVSAKIVYTKITHKKMSNRFLDEIASLEEHMDVSHSLTHKS